MRRVAADPNRLAYPDQALQSAAEADGKSADFAEAFADQIPNAHGAPKRATKAEAPRDAEATA